MGESVHQVCTLATIPLGYQIALVAVLVVLVVVVVVIDTVSSTST